MDVLKTRLERDDFQADVPVNGGPMRVSFPPQWPGDALGLFPAMVKGLESRPDAEPWGGTMISRSEHLAVGQMGFKSPPDVSGAVAIGYGVNASHRNRGYATEMTQALTAWALKHPSVKQVLAESAEGNRGSIRVLEKAGFRRVGRRLDPEEGVLLLWAQRR